MIKITENKNKLDFYVNAIRKEKNFTEERVLELIEDKKNSFQGLITGDAAAAMVSRDLKIEVNYESPKVITETLELEEPVKEKLDLVVPKTQHEIVASRSALYPSEAEIMFLIERRKFVKSQIINKKEDIVIINKKPYLMKSGTQKYINAFGISIEILDSKVYPKDDDIIAEYRIKATAPNGQFVIADGTNNKSEYWSKQYQSYGSYSLHILKAKARTRAIHIAVSDIIGYGELGFASLPANEPEKVFEFEE